MLEERIKFGSLPSLYLGRFLQKDHFIFDLHSLYNINIYKVISLKACIAKKLISIYVPHANLLLVSSPFQKDDDFLTSVTPADPKSPEKEKAENKNTQKYR